MWSCDLCISGECSDPECLGGRQCQAAFCTPPLREDEPCPVCGYDCAGANPPPMYCPMEGKRKVRQTPHEQESKP
jgi:hypothetical protein